MKKIILFILTLFVTQTAFSQATLDYKPNILLVTAHPDDDALFSATVFKTTKLLGGTVDLALMTNGEGGYKYSTLGNYIYGLELDNEEVGRAYLPGIRKKELMAGGDIVGIRNYYFFDKKDFYYTLDVQETMEKWETETVVKKLTEIMEEGNYDFVFLMLPFKEFHGHHKASAVLGLEALSRLSKGNRPIALESMVRRGDDAPGAGFTELEGYPKTRIMKDVMFEFDRNQKFGFNDQLDYNMVANWVVAEHKSQGTMQKAMNHPEGTVEQYYYVELNGTEGIEKARKFFEVINAIQPD